MFEFLNHCGLPVKYAVIGLLSGILWLIIAFVIGYEDDTPWAGLIGMTLGGVLAGYLRQRRGKSG